MLENDGSTLTWSKVVTKSGPEIPDLYPCPPCRTGRSLNQTRPRGMHQNNIQVLDCPSSADSNAWPTSIKVAGRDDATSLIAGGSTTTAVESLNCDDEITCSAPEISSYSSDER
eukprot:scaffold144648_cov39-Cyclotella_meneghiniana.AAC.1